MEESVTVQLCFFFANFIGAIIYAWLLILHTQPPYRMSIEILSNVILGIGIVAVIWPYFAKAMIRRTGNTPTAMSVATKSKNE